eukprot:364694-Chlamydomonas_euryale.AAC.1
MTFTKAISELDARTSRSRYSRGVVAQPAPCCACASSGARMRCRCRGCCCFGGRAQKLCCDVLLAAHQRFLARAMPELLGVRCYLRPLPPMLAARIPAAVLAGFRPTR